MSASRVEKGVSSHQFRAGGLLDLVAFPSLYPD
jgi:hypothetical protein